MRVAGSVPEIPLPAGPRRVRRQRLLCLGFLPLLALPLLLVSGPFAPVDRAAPVALRSMPGASSYTSTTEPSAPSAAAAARSPLPAETTTVTEATTTTTTVIVPEAKGAPPTTATTTPPTTAPPTTAPPTTAPATTAPPTTAPPAPAVAEALAAPAPPTTVAPRPTTTLPPTTTTTAAPTPAPANRQSGQATWYRWKKGNCAHNTLPKGTRVRVTAVASGRSTTCVVGDRGAFRNPTIIDLDASVFEQIAPLGAGRINVVISW